MDSKIKYIVVTHFYASGPAQFLNKYFIKKNIPHRYIEHPFIYSNRNYSAYSDYFGSETQRKKGINSMTRC